MDKNEQGIEQAATEMRKHLFENLIGTVLREEELDIEKNVLLFRAVGKYCEEHYDLPDQIKTDILCHIERYPHILERIFSIDMKDLMAVFDQDYINWSSPDTFEKLATINEFYTALLGLWLLDEIDPTEGVAWKMIDECILKVQKNHKAFIGAKKMVSHFSNPQSINPIHQLWREMAGNPITLV